VPRPRHADPPPKAATPGSSAGRQARQPRSGGAAVCRRLPWPLHHQRSASDSHGMLSVGRPALSAGGPEGRGGAARRRDVHPCSAVGTWPAPNGRAGPSAGGVRAKGLRGAARRRDVHAGDVPAGDGAHAAGGGPPALHERAARAAHDRRRGGRARAVPGACIHSPWLPSRANRRDCFWVRTKRKGFHYPSAPASAARPPLVMACAGARRPHRARRACRSARCAPRREASAGHASSRTWVEKARACRRHAWGMLSRAVCSIAAGYNGLAAGPDREPAGRDPLLGRAPGHVRRPAVGIPTGDARALPRPGWALRPARARPARAASRSPAVHARTVVVSCRRAYEHRGAVGAIALHHRRPQCRHEAVKKNPQGR
jgi:hypothetical protein